jgi:hypothetical protein
VAGSSTGFYEPDGAWAKYVQVAGGAWSGADFSSYYNYFGTYCDGSPWGWCAEWGIGGVYNGVLPDWSYTYNESYALGANPDLRYVTLRAGASRSAACGF